MRQQWRHAAVAALAGLSAMSSGTLAAQQAPAPAERVAALKQSLQQSQANLRKYEWIETTIISLKGEEKSRRQQRCFYGADGKLQKLPIAAPEPAADSGRGRRGGRLKERIVENKKDEIQEYMERAVGLVHQYVPPNPEALDGAKQAGKIALTPAPGGRASLQFKDFIKPGDVLGVEIDNATNALAGLFVNSYLDEPADVVALNVEFGALADGTNYASQVTLDAKAKNVRVVIQNSGYRPIGQ
jgi:hypothetical protein